MDPRHSSNAANVKWRVLYEHNVEHDLGLATDDALARLAGSQSATLRLYTYQPCALVGRFQHVEDQVYLDRCRRLQIPVNRRPSGGGAIIMGPDQLGIALVLGAEHKGLASSVRLIQQCALGIVNSLRELGIEAEFHGKNDLVVNGRKIAGLGLYQAPSRATLFHASLLLDLDLDFMLEILRTPFEKSQDRGFRSVSDRITTVRAETGSSMEMSDLIRCVKGGFLREYSARPEVGRLSSSEVALTAELCERQYATEQWIFQNSAEIRDRMGTCEMRTAGGSLEVRAIVAGETVKSVFLNGDFIASSNAVADLESSLRWHVRDEPALHQTIQQSLDRNNGAWAQISAEEITTAVIQALSHTSVTAPQTCFANQGAEFG